VIVDSYLSFPLPTQVLTANDGRPSAVRLAADEQMVLVSGFTSQLFSLLSKIPQRYLPDVKLIERLEARDLVFFFGMVFGSLLFKQ